MSLALVAARVTELAGCTSAGTDAEPISFPPMTAMRTPTASSPSLSSGPKHGDAVDDPAKIELAKQSSNVHDHLETEQGLQPHRS